LLGYAAQLDLDANAFDTCLEGREFTEKGETSGAESSQAGVIDTPTMFLRKILADGKVKLAKRIIGARPFGNMPTGD